MKKFMVILSGVLLAGALAACGKKDDATDLEKIQESLISMESFSCVADVTQQSNKGEKVYAMKQDAKISGEYRIEALSPEKIAGTVTIFNGTAAFQHNPRVAGSLKIDLPVSQLRNEILLTSFVKNYLNSEEVAVETSKTDGAVSTVLEAVIPGTNPYMVKEKVWFSNETHLPERLVIYDDQDAERIVVSYREIEYNKELGDELFTITAPEAAVFDTNGQPVVQP